ncbi:hypothetical protein QBC47DRAFT_312030 [Echria macrotheca]|uniref:Uncharacterized protein n=1 Tax=Echria macrotheca TaxID=438768 RepID=A0AAJ0B0G9_9PEZI|nr:hypothetical protein QBC47DRAFT_312030 [Echria macrotheca]
MHLPGFLSLVFGLISLILAHPGNHSSKTKYLTASTTSSTASPFSTRPPVRHCGGITPQPNPCPKGLVCAPTQPPGSFDLPGTCILQSCGGKSPTISPCPSGQVCVYNATAPITDLPGRCMAAVLTCGGEGDEKCKSGWECAKEGWVRVDWNYRGDVPDLEKGGGICIPVGSLVVDEPWSGWGV